MSERERERGCLGEIHLSGPSCVRSLLLLRARTCMYVCVCVAAAAAVATHKRKGDDAVWQLQLRTMMKMMAMM